MLSSLRLAARSLLKTPAFTAIAVITLALGIGLNTAMFSLINLTLLRPLPFSHAEKMVRLHRTTPDQQNDEFSPADYLDLKRAESAFGVFAAYTNSSVSVAEPGVPAEIQNAKRISADYLPVLNVAVELGRGFRADEENPGGPAVVMLTHPYWQARFAGAPDVIGRSIRVDGVPSVIVGVLPEWASDGRIIRDVGILQPLRFTREELAARDHAWVSVIGRRADAVDAAAAEGFVAAFGARLAADFPKENAGTGWRSETLLHSTRNHNGVAVMSMLLGLSGFVLLIACSNLANFLLARAIARAHEIAVRAALGASRWQLIKPLALEALLLAAAGGVSALVVAGWSARWLSAQSVASGGSPLDFPLDWRVLGFAVGASLVTALFFGVVPALFASRVDVNQALKSSGRGATAGRSHQRLRRLLVVGQFSLATVLLAGAGFFVRGAANLAGQQFGWSAEQVMQGEFDLPAGIYAQPGQVRRFQESLLARVGQLPGVESASVSYALPSSGLPGPRQYRVEGRPAPAKGQGISASFNGITVGYFAATGTRLLRGRGFESIDQAASPRVVVLSESLARALFAGENPLGHRIAPADAAEPQWAEIVGVVSDVGSISIYQPPVLFQVYHPFAQEPWNHGTLAVRATGGGAASLAAPIRAAVAALDPDLPLRELMSASDRAERAAFDLTMLKQMLGAFALLGLLLAALGIYGVIARTVAQRTGEIGLRLALGAQVSDVINLVLGSGLRLALAGAGIGLFGAYGLSRVIGGMMPAMQSNGGWVLAGAILLLVAVALLACYLPARTAAKVDPIAALRAE